MGADGSKADEELISSVISPPTFAPEGIDEYHVTESIEELGMNNLEGTESKEIYIAPGISAIPQDFKEVFEQKRSIIMINITKDDQNTILRNIEENSQNICIITNVCGMERIHQNFTNNNGIRIYSDSFDLNPSEIPEGSNVLTDLNSISSLDVENFERFIFLDHVKCLFDYSYRIERLLKKGKQNVIFLDSKFDIKVVANFFGYMIQ